MEKQSYTDTDKQASEGRVITAGEVIEYLQGFDKDKGVKILVTDTHQDRKIAFGITDLIWITDEGPAIWINIDRNVNEDITANKEDEPL